jgi:hypothetical protein
MIRSISPVENTRFLQKESRIIGKAMDQVREWPGNENMPNGMRMEQFHFCVYEFL